MFLHSFYTPGLSINSYFVGDSGTKSAAIIDPTPNVDTYIDYAKNEGYTISHILETHVHADFVSGAQELKERLRNNSQICSSDMGGEEWTPKYADRHIKDGEIVDLGSIKLKAFHTPGHTPEHLIWVCFDETRSKETPSLAFTGDLLFVGSVGRPDLLGENQVKALSKQLHNSLFTVLNELPDFLEIFPAHGAGSICGKGLSARPSSTLGYERLFNPFLIKKPLEEWLEALVVDSAAIPINYPRIKKLNVEGVSSLKQNENEEAPTLYIDVRPPEEFSRGYYRGAINIPLGSGFCNWLGSVLAENIPIAIIAIDSNSLEEAVKNLKFIGFTHVVKKIIWNDTSPDPTETMPLIDVETLAKKIKESPQSVYILDVRTETEWKNGHIAEAHHLELPLIMKKMDLIPRQVEISVICGSGMRASLVASILKKNGYQDVANVKGGMAAWSKSKLSKVTLK